MVKGISRQVIVVHSPDPKLFEQAIFILKENAVREGVTDEANEKEVMKVYTALEKYFPSWVGYNMAKCGGCIRACVSMLEKKGGCMEGRFENPLRRGNKPWKMDR